MKYWINYTEEGKILGFYLEEQLSNLNIQVSNQVWTENQGMNKIIIDKNKNITFEKVDWKTAEEIEEDRIISINNKVEEIITRPYPIYKQLNIRGQLNPYTMEDLEMMNMFIDTVRYIGKDAKSNGTKVEDINWAGLDEYLTSNEIIESDLLSIRQLVKAV